MCWYNKNGFLLFEGLSEVRIIGFPVFTAGLPVSTQANG
jgi:hypothetical protein